MMDCMTSRPLRPTVTIGVVAVLAALAVAAGPNTPAERRWAFGPIVKREPPADANGWSANPVDRFLRAKHSEHGLVPAGPADRRALLRRITFDLTGLPST